MPLREQFSALYALYYKRGARDAYFQPGLKPVAGLSAADMKVLGSIDPLRFETIVRLHQRDIAGQWYRAKVPASWLALGATLGMEDAELVEALTSSPSFELHVDDDRDCAALLGWISELAKARKLPDARWLPELVRYELVLAGRWQGEANPRVESFAWDVESIATSLLRDHTLPVGERPKRYAAVFHRDAKGVTEARLSTAEAAAMQAILQGKQEGIEVRMQKRCQKLLRDIQG
jgi:hypothetical protein